MAKNNILWHIISQSIVIYSIVFHPSLFAAEITEDHLKAARSAIQALNVTTQFNNILPNIAERLKTNLIQTYPNYSDSITAVVNEEALKLAPRRADLEKEAAHIYARSFTIYELNSISSFYNSEAGKKLLVNGPLIMRDMVKSADIWASGISRDISRNTDDSLTKIIKEKPLPIEGLNSSVGQ